MLACRTIHKMPGLADTIFKTKYVPTCKFVASSTSADLKTLQSRVNDLQKRVAELESGADSLTDTVNHNARAFNKSNKAQTTINKIIGDAVFSPPMDANQPENGE